MIKEDREGGGDREYDVEVKGEGRMRKREKERVPRRINTRGYLVLASESSLALSEMEILHTGERKSTKAIKRNQYRNKQERAEG